MATYVGDGGGARVADPAGQFVEAAFRVCAPSYRASARLPGLLGYEGRLWLVSGVGFGPDANTAWCREVVPLTGYQGELTLSWVSKTRGTGPWQDDPAGLVVVCQRTKYVVLASTMTIVYQKPSGNDSPRLHIPRQLRLCEAAPSLPGTYLSGS